MSGQPPTLVAVCGLPGVGKSTVSSYISERLDCPRLRSDVIRKELVDDPIYSDAERNRVYDELLTRAGTFLERNEPVVLDATFSEDVHRAAVVRVASAHDVPFRLVRVVCNQSVVENRIAAREDISDADVAVYRQFQSEFDPLRLDHVRVDNSGSLSEMREQVDELF